MKKSSSKGRRARVSIILAIAVLGIVFCGCGVVMAATQDVEDEIVQTEPEEIEDIDVQEQPDPEEFVEEDIVMKGTPDDQDMQVEEDIFSMTLQANKPPKVTNLKATAGFKKVILSWKTIDKPAGDSNVTVLYRVYRNGKQIDEIKDKGKTNKITKSYAAKEGPINKYNVSAVYRKGNNKPTVGAKSKTVRCGAVRPIKYKFTTTTSAPYYTTYKGSRVGGHLKKGKKYSATGAKNTRFCINVKGKNGWLPLKYTTRRYAEYVKGSHKYYSKAEAENFVNGRKVTSKTNHLIWVSCYAQRVYRFEKSGGKWVCKSHYTCATGGMSAPTPSGKLKIWSHLYINHGLYYWSNFYSITAMHQTPSSSIGYPSSTGGCVRMYIDSAKYIYEHVPTNSTVLVF